MQKALDHGGIVSGVREMSNTLETGGQSAYNGGTNRCHPRAGGDPESVPSWIPACAGMTAVI